MFSPCHGQVQVCDRTNKLAIRVALSLGSNFIHVHSLQYELKNYAWMYVYLCVHEHMWIGGPSLSANRYCSVLIPSYRLSVSVLVFIVGVDCRSLLLVVVGS